MDPESYLHLFPILHDVLIIGAVLNVPNEVRLDPVPVALARVRWRLARHQISQNSPARVAVCYRVHQSLSHREHCKDEAISAIKVHHVQKRLIEVARVFAQGRLVLDYHVFNVSQPGDSCPMSVVPRLVVVVPQCVFKIMFRQPEQPLNTLFLVLVLNRQENNHEFNIRPQLHHSDVVEPL